MLKRIQLLKLHSIPFAAPHSSLAASGFGTASIMSSGKAPPRVTTATPLSELY